MIKFTLILLVVVTLVICVAFVSRTKLQDDLNRYAIQNVETGKNLRPFQAGKADSNRLVLYNHHNWKCMTWDFVKVAGETYRLQNRYTSKTFQTSKKPEANATLCQQPLSTDSIQEWEFVKQPGDAYLIKLKGTDLYVSISSKETNSDIILLPLQNSKSQLWRLVKQNPMF